jgi:hypothetical protein
MKWVAILCLAVIACLAPAQAWKVITSKEAGLKFSVPVQPKTSTRTDTDRGYSVQTRMWLAQSTTNYVVSVSFLPKNMPAGFSKNMVDGIKSGFVQSTGGKVVSDKIATYAGITGRQISITVPSGVNGALWIVQRNSKIYTFTVAKQGKSYEAEKAKFYNSIKLS